VTPATHTLPVASLPPAAPESRMPDSSHAPLSETATPNSLRGFRHPFAALLLRQSEYELLASPATPSDGTRPEGEGPRDDVTGNEETDRAEGDRLAEHEDADFPTEAKAAPQPVLGGAVIVGPGVSGLAPEASRLAPGQPREMTTQARSEGAAPSNPSRPRAVKLGSEERTIRGEESGVSPGENLWPYSFLTSPTDAPSPLKPPGGEGAIFGTRKPEAPPQPPAQARRNRPEAPRRNTGDAPRFLKPWSRATRPSRRHICGLVGALASPARTLFCPARNPEQGRRRALSGSSDHWSAGPRETANPYPPVDGG